jgi:hypothetical protein
MFSIIAVIRVLDPSTLPGWPRRHLGQEKSRKVPTGRGVDRAGIDVRLAVIEPATTPEGRATTGVPRSSPGWSTLSLIGRVLHGGGVSDRLQFNSGVESLRRLFEPRAR